MEETSTIHPDIAVSSPIVSRAHGEFTYMDDGWFYIDNSGKNGTFINGEKVPAGKGKRRYPILLNDGDMLRVDYSDLSDPDPRGVFVLYTEKSVTGVREAKKLFMKSL